MRGSNRNEGRERKMEHGVQLRNQSISLNCTATGSFQDKESSSFK